MQIKRNAFDITRTARENCINYGFFLFSDTRGGDDARNNILQYNNCSQ